MPERAEYSAVGSKHREKMLFKHIFSLAKVVYRMAYLAKAIGGGRLQFASLM